MPDRLDQSCLERWGERLCLSSKSVLPTQKPKVLPPAQLMKGCHWPELSLLGIHEDQVVSVYVRKLH